MAGQPDGNECGVLVQFRVSVKNHLPDTLLELAKKHGDPDEIADFEEEATAAQRGELDLYRNIRLPGVPRAGDDVLANPNYGIVTVRSVEWILDPYDDWHHVVVWLDDIDEDEYGFGVETFLEHGWKPVIEL